MELLVRNTDPENVWFQPDVYWMQCAGVEPSSALTLFAGREFSMHVEDYAVRPLEGVIEPVPRRCVAVGEGNMNYRGIIAQAAEVGVARDGKWTIDLMGQYNEAVAKDLNGDGEMTDKDVWGVVHDSYNSYNVFWTACDNYMIAKNDKGDFEIVVNTQRTVNSIDKCVKALSNPKIAKYCDEVISTNYDKWYFGFYTFCAGQALFETAFPHALVNHSEEADFDYTVIPFPKFDENQKNYITTPDPNAMVFGIPVTVQDTDFPGFMLEALSAESTDTTLRTLLRGRVQVQVFRKRGQRGDARPDIQQYPLRCG